MDEFANIWIEQCEAARDIRDAWGTKKALGYVIGEKFLNYIRASDSNSDWAQNIPLFTAEIKRIFTVDELHTYFATTTRVGTSGLPRMSRPTTRTSSCARPACSTTT